MRIHNVNVFDKRYLLQDIAIAITLTRSAVDNREGEGVSVLENQHRRHRIEFIDFPRDSGKCRAGIGISLEFNGEK